jgi:hypothetical protein
VLEDNPAWTAERLRAEGFDEDVVEGVLAVTRRQDEDYFDFVCRAAANPIGRQVKLADLADNMDMSRLHQPSERDRLRLLRYEQAVRITEGRDAAARGN